MDAYRVICHPGDEDEGVRWACRAQQQRRSVEIVSGPAHTFKRPRARNFKSKTITKDIEIREINNVFEFSEFFEQLLDITEKFL